MSQEKEVKLKNTKEIELPVFDIEPYLGLKVKIGEVKEYQGMHGYYIKVKTEALATIDRDGEDIDIKGSRIFGLQSDAEGNIGWGEKTKLGIFLKKMNVKHYNDLVGKEVMTQSRTDKEGNDFIEFN